MISKVVEVLPKYTVNDHISVTLALSSPEFVYAYGMYIFTLPFSLNNTFTNRLFVYFRQL